MFAIFPAIDLRHGRVVRLRQGRAEAETVYAHNPARTARLWKEQGAEWLHVVNLDGAFGDPATLNLSALEGILRAVSIPVQFGGGLRDLESITRVLGLGVTRVVLGTAAVENPQLVADAVAIFGSARILVGIDAREGFVAVHGWRQPTQVRAVDLALQMRELGVERVVYTDIARDGMLQGIDAAAMVSLAQATGLGIIASGGISGLLDIEALAARAGDGIEGVIVGQALYSGALSLSEALKIAARATAQGD